MFLQSQCPRDATRSHSLTSLRAEAVLSLKSLITLKLPSVSKTTASASSINLILVGRSLTLPSLTFPNPYFLVISQRLTIRWR